jgi:hypothetical protein
MKHNFFPRGGQQMRKSINANVLVVSILAGAALAAPLALPVGAALKPSVTCAKVSIPPVKGGNGKATISQCTPASLSAGGTSTFKAGTGATSGKLVMTITWSKGKGKTVATVKYGTVATKGKCTTIAGTSRVAITGSVTSATGAAAAITKKGEPVTVSACSVTSGAKLGQTVLEPGTKFTL